MRPNLSLADAIVHIRITPAFALLADTLLTCNLLRRVLWSIRQSMRQSVNLFINQSVNQSFKQFINQSVNNSSIHKPIRGTVGTEGAGGGEGRADAFGRTFQEGAKNGLQFICLKLF